MFSLVDLRKNKDLFSLSQLSKILNLSFKYLYKNPPLKEHLGHAQHQNQDLFYERKNVIQFLEEFTFYPNNFDRGIICPCDDVFLRKKNAAEFLKTSVSKLDNIKRSVSKTSYPLPYFKYSNILRYRHSHLEKYRNVYSERKAPPTADYVFNKKCLHIQEKSRKRIRVFSNDLIKLYPDAAYAIELFSFATQGIFADHIDNVKDASEELKFNYLMKNHSSSL